MEQKGISIMAKCEECSKEFKVDKDNLIYQEPFTVVSDDKEIYLTHYACPRCGKIHYVQIDDATTTGRQIRAEAQFKKLADKQIGGGSVTINQNNKFKQTRKGLGKARNALMKRYQGQKVKDRNGEEFILRFSV